MNAYQQMAATASRASKHQRATEDALDQVLALVSASGDLDLQEKCAEIKQQWVNEMNPHLRALA